MLVDCARVVTKPAQGSRSTQVDMCWVSWSGRLPFQRPARRTAQPQPQQSARSFSWRSPIPNTGVLYVQVRPEDVMANTLALQGVTFRTPARSIFTRGVTFRTPNRACIVPTNCG